MIFTKLMQFILNYLTEKFEELDYLLSLTLVGSARRFINAKKIISNSNFLPTKVLDLDFVIIIDELNDKKITAVDKIFIQLCRSIKQAGIKVLYETRTGPIKLATDKKFKLMLHRLLYDERLYQNYCQINKLTPYNWQYQPPLIGKYIWEICKVDNITKKDIIESRSGINHYIQMIENGIVNPRVLKRIDSNYEYITENLLLKGQCYVKLTLDSVIKCAGNVLKLIQPIYVEDEYQIGRLFFNRFNESISVKELPLIFAYYKDILNSIPFKIPPYLKNELKKQSLNFLSELKMNLEA
jgi:hypothetical protein